MAESIQVDGGGKNIIRQQRADQGAAVELREGRIRVCS